MVETFVFRTASHFVATLAEFIQLRNNDTSVKNFHRICDELEAEDFPINP